MQIEGNKELQKEVFRALVDLTRERRNRHIYNSPTSIAGRVNKNGCNIYPYYVSRLLDRYVRQGLVDWVSTPSETGRKEYTSYRANLRKRREIERELRDL